jgi:hypothetical protein
MSEVYYCPTVGEVEQYPDGGFDMCCAAPDRHVTREQIATALGVCTCPSGRNQHGYWRQVQPTCPACGDVFARADAVLALLSGDGS